MSFKFNKSNNKSTILIILFVVILALYSATGIFYYEKAMKDFKYLLIISRFSIFFGGYINFISLIDVVERIHTQNNKKVRKKFWLPIAIAIDILYCIIEGKTFHINFFNFLALGLFKIIHEFLAIIVVPVCSVSILLAMYFRCNIYSSFKKNINENLKNFEKTIELYLSNRVFARQIARKFVLSSMFLSVWGSSFLFLFFFIIIKDLKFPQLLSDEYLSIMILPALFVLSPLMYVLLNLYCSAEELDNLHLIKLKMFSSSCHEFQSDHENICKLKLLKEAELKPDFVESLFFPAIINLLIAYLPLFFKI